jgi:cation-transporting ATPase E
MRFCIPAGLVAGTAALTAYLMARYTEDLTLRQSRTTATLVLVVCGLWILVMLARPFSVFKGVLVAAMAGAVAIILLVPAFQDFYALSMPDTRVLGEAALIAAAAIFLLEVGWRAAQRLQSRRRAVHG